MSQMALIASFPACLSTRTFEALASSLISASFEAWICVPGAAVCSVGEEVSMEVAEVSLEVADDSLSGESSDAKGETSDTVSEAGFADGGDWGGVPGGLDGRLRDFVGGVSSGDLITFGLDGGGFSSATDGREREILICRRRVGLAGLWGRGMTGRHISDCIVLPFEGYMLLPAKSQHPDRGDTAISSSYDRAHLSIYLPP